VIEPSLPGATPPETPASPEGRTSVWNNPYLFVLPSEHYRMFSWPVSTRRNARWSWLTVS
jgi:hypothetical protein